MRLGLLLRLPEPDGARLHVPYHVPEEPLLDQPDGRGAAHVRTNNLMLEVLCRNEKFTLPFSKFHGCMHHWDFHMEDEDDVIHDGGIKMEMTPPATLRLKLMQIS